MDSGATTAGPGLHLGGVDVRIGPLCNALRQPDKSVRPTALARINAEPPDSIHLDLIALTGNRKSGPALRYRQFAGGTRESYNTQGPVPVSSRKGASRLVIEP